jgi:hypothetical protein
VAVIEENDTNGNGKFQMQFFRFQQGYSPHARGALTRAASVNARFMAIGKALGRSTQPELKREGRTNFMLHMQHKVGACFHVSGFGACIEKQRQNAGRGGCCCMSKCEVPLHNCHDGFIAWSLRYD